MSNMRASSPARSLSTGSVTSSFTNRMLGWCFSASTQSSCSWVCTPAMTPWPRAASRSAAASPMPEPAPVMRMFMVGPSFRLRMRSKSDCAPARAARRCASRAVSRPSPGRNAGARRQARRPGGPSASRPGLPQRGGRGRIVVKGGNLYVATGSGPLGAGSTACALTASLARTSRVPCTPRGPPLLQNDRNLLFSCGASCATPQTPHRDQGFFRDGRSPALQRVFESAGFGHFVAAGAVLLDARLRLRHRRRNRPEWPPIAAPQRSPRPVWQPSSPRRSPAARCLFASQMWGSCALGRGRTRQTVADMV